MSRLLLSWWPLGLVLLGACHAESPAREPLDSAQRPLLAAPFPVVQDTVVGAASPLAATWLALTAHRLLYIGHPQDSLLLQHTLTAYAPHPGFVPRGPFIGAYALADEQRNRARHWKTARHARLHLSLDTGQVIKAEEYYNQDVRTDTLSRWFAAYPVLVRSLEPDTILIGDGDYIPLEVEAQDPLGQWRPIEKPFMHFCGTGMPSMMLPPQQIALTSMLISHGPFFTWLRVRLGPNYSPAFRVRIHLRQFESMFDQEGDYQAEYVREHPELRTNTP